MLCYKQRYSKLYVLPFVGVRKRQSKVKLKWMDLEGHLEASQKKNEVQIQVQRNVLCQNVL